jgi:hypothetical protein
MYPSPEFKKVALEEMINEYKLRDTSTKGSK